MLSVVFVGVLASATQLIFTVFLQLEVLKSQTGYYLLCFLQLRVLSSAKDYITVRFAKAIRQIAPK